MKKYLNNNLEYRRNQALQRRIIAEMSAQDPASPPVDRNERLVGFLGALESICLVGLPWMMMTQTSLRWAGN